jgi:hypothetical protein
VLYHDVVPKLTLGNAESARGLDDLLRRAERHLDKKTPQLPRLRSWAGA